MIKNTEDNLHEEITDIREIHNRLNQDTLDFEHFNKVKRHKAPDITKNFTSPFRIPLKHPDNIPNSNENLISVLKQRESKRDFANKPIRFEELSLILHYSCGIRKYGRGIYNRRTYPLKYVPSMGGLSPIDCYVQINNVKDIPKGLYYYNPEDDTLELLDDGNIRAIIQQHVHMADFAFFSAFNMILVANLDRIYWKYKMRSYRFVHVDTGVIAQNAHLIGTSLNISSCLLAGYKDDMLNAYLKLSETEFVTLMIVFGQEVDQE